MSMNAAERETLANCVSFHVMTRRGPLHLERRIRLAPFQHSLLK